MDYQQQEFAALHPTVQDHRIHCPPYANENIDWCFDGCNGWRRTTCAGNRWRDAGELDDWARPFLLRHFGLDVPATAALYPLARLRLMSPEELRAQSNERRTAVG
jgi:hypothetical protein